MLLHLELDSETPLYLQIRNQIVEGIASGQLPPGVSLPSTRQLAADFGINFHTVNKAYDLLRQEGLIRLQRKTGAIVAVDPGDEPFASLWRKRLRTLLAEGVVKGMSDEQILATAREVLAAFHRRDHT